MDTFEQASPAEPTQQEVEAVCWECGDRKICQEYVVCCTGSLFHVCADCQEKLHTDSASAELATATHPTTGTEAMPSAPGAVVAAVLPDNLPTMGVVPPQS